MTTFRVAISGKYHSSDDWTNVYTFSDEPGVADIPVPPTLTTWINGMYPDAMLGILSGIITIDRAVLEVPVAGKWQYRYEVAINKQGQKSGDALPQQMAAVIIGVTASRRRAKKFIAGLCEDGQNGGILDNATLGVLRAFGDRWAAPLTSGDNPFFAGVCKRDGTGFETLTATRVDAVLGTQRRRKQGVGS